MENKIIKDFLNKIQEEKKKKTEQNKRRNYFREIGRKGGLSGTKNEKKNRRITIRFTQREFQKIESKAIKSQLNISEYVRLIILEKKLIIEPYKEDEILRRFGTNFIRISNLLKNKEWNVFSNKKEIMELIQSTTKGIHEHLILKNSILKKQQEDE